MLKLQETTYLLLTNEGRPKVKIQALPTAAGNVFSNIGTTETCRDMSRKS